MLIYLLNNIVTFFLLYFFKGRYFLLFLLSLISVAVIIYFLPDGAPDYMGYKWDYESGALVDHFPYFDTAGRIDSEPYYKNYTAFIRVTTGLSFPAFLALNFIVGYSVLYYGFRQLFKEDAAVTFMMIGFVSIVPTIFYYLVRSSVPYILVVLVFLLYVNKKPILAILVSFIAMGFHSQYIPALFILGFSYFWFELFLKNNVTKYKLTIFGIVVAILLLIIYKWAAIILSSISFLPTSTEFLQGKSKDLLGGHEGFRITSILSLVVFPFLYYYLLKGGKFYEVMKDNISEDVYFRFLFLFGSAIFLAFVTNLVFFNIPHVSGRLSRFSDYTSMIVLLGTFFMTVKDSKRILPMLMLIMAASAPFIYAGLYDFDLSIIEIW